MRVLLHACCGPCLLEPLDSLSEEHDVEIAYANPNIFPREEYALRRDTLIAYARHKGVPVSELPYVPRLWTDAVQGVVDDASARCRACYELRLTMVAREAAERGFDAIASTLTVSPYQDHEGIREAGKAAAAGVGIRYMDRDFRDRYPAAARRSRELGMYRQNYCGCEPSRREAEEQRQVRRSRKAERLG